MNLLTMLTRYSCHSDATADVLERPHFLCFSLHGAIGARHKGCCFHADSAAGSFSSNPPSEFYKWSIATNIQCEAALISAAGLLGSLFY